MTMKRLFVIILLFFLATTYIASQPNAWINEIHYDNTGGDVGEFVEVVIENPGGSDLLEGDLITKTKLRELNSELTRKDKEKITVRDSEPATFGNVLLGITQAALSTESFLSAASFQETTKVLTNAAIAAKVDTLVGLKENVIMGHIIPAGTGLKKYDDIILTEEETAESTETTEVSEVVEV